VTLKQLWQHVIGDGWWPYVVSGTMFPTVGGAAAMNIHGKNHLTRASSGITSFTSISFCPAPVRSSAAAGTKTRDLFFAALGGFGVLGVFTEIRLRLKKIHSGLLNTRQHVAANLTEMFDRFEAICPTSDYAVGWIDGFADGKELGRGLIQTGHFLPTARTRTPPRHCESPGRSFPTRSLASFRSPSPGA
jgi:hypothetical protein